MNDRLDFFKARQKTDGRRAQVQKLQIHPDRDM
jgi:hypothetical protein